MINKIFFNGIFAFLVTAIIFFLPYQKHLLYLNAEIFPALDLIVIFIITIHYPVKYWHLFIVGLLMDYLNGTYDGLYPLILITAQIIIRYFTKQMVSISYFFKLILFIVYISWIIIMKYMIISIMHNTELSITILVLYYLFSILTYPIIYIFLERILRF